MFKTQFHRILNLLIVIIEMDEDCLEDILEDCLGFLERGTMEEDVYCLGGFFADGVLGVVETLDEGWVEVAEVLV